MATSAPGTPKSKPPRSMSGTPPPPAKRVSVSTEGIDYEKLGSVICSSTTTSLQNLIPQMFEQINHQASETLKMHGEQQAAQNAILHSQIADDLKANQTQISELTTFLKGTTVEIKETQAQTKKMLNSFSMDVTELKEDMAKFKEETYNHKVGSSRSSSASSVISESQPILLPTNHLQEAPTTRIRLNCGGFVPPGSDRLVHENIAVDETWKLVKSLQSKYNDMVWKIWAPSRQVRTTKIELKEGTSRTVMWEFITAVKDAHYKFQGGGELWLAPPKTSEQIRVSQSLSIFFKSLLMVEEANGVDKAHTKVQCCWKSKCVYYDQVKVYAISKDHAEKFNWSRLAELSPVMNQQAILQNCTQLRHELDSRF